MSLSHLDSGRKKRKRRRLGRVKVKGFGQENDRRGEPMGSPSREMDP